MTEFQGPEERRDEERSDCALSARIELNDRLFLPCLVTNLSATGVRLKIDPATNVPDAFDLLVPAIPGADQRFRVKQVWRRDEEVGGTFLPPP